MEMNYFKKTGKMMVAACMLAGLPFIPGTVSASELQTQMMSVQMESTTLKELFDYKYSLIFSVGISFKYASPIFRSSTIVNVPPSIFLSLVIKS